MRHEDKAPSVSAGDKPTGEAQDKASVAWLLPRVRERDEAAARELVERLYPLVARIVQANLPRRDAPEDLMQEVFLKMFSKLEQYQGEARFEHWVARIAVTTCLDHLRRQKARPELRWADLPADQQAMVESAAADDRPLEADSPHALALLNSLLAQLPAQDAWLLRKVELEEKSIDEVCRETGWNGGAARVRLFRARRRLQALFGRLERKGM